MMKKISEFAPAITIIAMMGTAVIGYYTGQAVDAHDDKDTAHLIVVKTHDENINAHLIVQKEIAENLAEDIATRVAAKLSGMP